VKDFNIIPDILQNASMEDERNWTLYRLSELLKISYELTQHPVLIDFPFSENIDIFYEALFSERMSKRLNRTLVERTIDQANYYADYRIGERMITMKSKGIELNILLLESFWKFGNELCIISKEDYEKDAAAIEFDRKRRVSELKASVLYFLDACNNLIEITQQQHILEQIATFKNDGEKIRYLVRQRTDFLHRQDQFTEKVYKNVMNTIDTELDYHKNIQEIFEIPAEIRAIVQKFLLEKNARISNYKLLAFLVEEKLEEFCEGLSELVLQLFSYHDIGGKDAEKVYHSFLIGFFNDFKEFYSVESNMEAGLGRFDILLSPDGPEMKGVILEVKKSDNDLKENIEAMQEEALNQIKEKQYASALKKRGLKQFFSIAAVFYGKKLYLKYRLNTI